MNKPSASSAKSKRSPWFWIPSLYFAEGLPYAVVMLLSVVLYKRMGVSNADITLYTSWLYLPWVIKPLWSPIVDILKTKRYWIIIMQVLIGAGLGGVALTIPMPGFFKLTLGFFWLLAFSSATHDIAADGFYMLGLSKHKQAWFVGIRSTFYRISIIFVQGILIMVAGFIESTTGLDTVTTTIITAPATQVNSIMKSDIISDLEFAEDQRIICEPDTLYIATELRNKSEIDSVVNFAKQWNIEQGQAAEEVVIKEKTALSWWGQIKYYLFGQLVDKLEVFLKANFGDKFGVGSDDSGNIGIINVSLSQQPSEDQEVVVNFGRESGDKSISCIEGDRIVFNSSNWNIPVMAVIQIDSKLKTISEAQFNARAGNIPLAWLITFFIMAGMFVIFFSYHKVMLPHPDQDLEHQKTDFNQLVSNFILTFKKFFTKERIVLSIAFILIYRFGEAQLVKIAPLFMLDAYEAGGMSLTTGQYGFIYGTLGALALTLGGILGGFVAARQGLKYWILWMALAMKFPDVVYVFLSYAQPDSFALIASCVAVEQFGYGFGFTAYMLFMITVAEGKHKTAHYALCTGFMALGMMIPGMFSGWLQELIGYQHFFIWVLFCTIPGLLMIKFLLIDPEFGKKKIGVNND